MEEEPVSNLLDRTLRAMGIRQQVRDVQIREVFAVVMGPAMLPFCRAERLERGTLVVASTNSALAHQIHMDSPRVIDAINERLGAKVVQRFRFIPLEGKSPV